MMDFGGCPAAAQRVSPQVIFLLLTPDYPSPRHSCPKLPNISILKLQLEDIIPY